MSVDSSDGGGGGGRRQKRVRVRVRVRVRWPWLKSYTLGFSEGNVKIVELHSSNGTYVHNKITDNVTDSLTDSISNRSRESSRAATIYSWHLFKATLK